MRDSKMCLHVAEPGVEFGEVGDVLVFYLVDVAFYVGGPLSHHNTRPRPNPLLPLRITLIEHLLHLYQLHIPLPLPLLRLLQHLPRLLLLLRIQMPQYLLRLIRKHLNKAIVLFAARIFELGEEFWRAVDEHFFVVEVAEVVVDVCDEASFCQVVY